jgi:arginyl-tRNA synthetase
MDNNVSKKTNSHNFFKLRFNQEKLDISVKNLLEQELLLILDLYQQKLNVQIKPKFVINILKAKIAVFPGKSSPTSWINNTWINNNSQLPPAQFPLITPLITYACPFGLSLATNLQQSPQTIMEQLGYLLSLIPNTTETETEWNLLIEIVSRGWINFYLNSKFIADWLKRSLLWSQTNNINDQQLTKSVIYSLDRTPGKLFSVQYIHARCCSLLSLGARENMITLSNNLKQIQQPQSICWLDREHNLWFTEVAEYNLLQQLLTVSDFWLENTEDRPNRIVSLGQWSKLALNLSHNTANFLADCRWLGEVKQQYPQKAIARLGLIALVQFWLEKILVEKLRVAAPREL